MPLLALKIDSLATKVYFVQPTLFEIVKTSGDFNGVQKKLLAAIAQIGRNYEQILQHLQSATDEEA